MRQMHPNSAKFIIFFRIAVNTILHGNTDKYMIFQTVQIAKKFTTLHYQYSDKIIQLARQKVEDGTPINLPLWWLDPTDAEALRIDSGESYEQNSSFIKLKSSTLKSV
jgi:alpha-glucosidase (family GH31 glycosyl hydrolase)